MNNRLFKKLTAAMETNRYKLINKLRENKLKNRAMNDSGTGTSRQLLLNSHQGYSGDYLLDYFNEVTSLN